MPLYPYNVTTLRATTPSCTSTQDASLGPFPLPDGWVSITGHLVASAGTARVVTTNSKLTLGYDGTSVSSPAFTAGLLTNDLITGCSADFTPCIGVDLSGAGKRFYITRFAKDSGGNEWWMNIFPMAGWSLAGGPTTMTIVLDNSVATTTFTATLTIVSVAMNVGNALGTFTSTVA